MLVNLLITELLHALSLFHNGRYSALVYEKY